MARATIIVAYTRPGASPPKLPNCRSCCVRRTTPCRPARAALAEPAGAFAPSAKSGGETRGETPRC